MRKTKKAAKRVAWVLYHRAGGRCIGLNSARVSLYPRRFGRKPKPVECAFKARTYWAKRAI